MKCLLSLIIFLSFFSCSPFKEAAKHETSVKTTFHPPLFTAQHTLGYIGALVPDTSIKSPWGISFGIDGSLYVCDRNSSTILRLDRNGKTLSRFNGFDSRTERVFLPIDISVSGGIEVYVLDGADSRVVRLDRNLKNSYAIFRPRDEDKNLFGVFNGIAFDKFSGDFFLTDGDKASIVRYESLSKKPRVTGAFGYEKSNLTEPAGIDVAANGAVYIADKGAGAIAVMPNFGARLSFIGKSFLESPSDVTVFQDSLLAVADKSGIMILGIDGAPKGIAGYGDGRNISPRSIAYLDNRIYISDAKSDSILVYGIEKK